MSGLVWACVFLLLVLLAFAVGCAGIIGMPIALEVQVGLYGAGLMLAGFGWLLLAALPRDSRALTSPAFYH